MVERYQGRHRGADGLLWSLPLGSGVLLLIGFFTPMAGVLVVIVEVWTALSRADNLRTCIVLAVVGAALAMLGPGIWSLDARFSDESVLTSVIA